MAAPVSTSAQAIEPGHEVGPYVLTREIGKGSFAVVFQGKIQPPQRREDDPSPNKSRPSTPSSSVPSTSVRQQLDGAASPVSRVAIKIVTRKKLTAKLLENLEGEISILRTVRHANIVELLDCLKTNSHIYLVMQFCRMGDLSIFIRTRRRPGQTLSSASQKEKRLTVSQQRDAFEEAMDKRYEHPHDGGLHGDVSRSFLAQLASAIQFMRSKNIVHRDIKPQNLLLQEPEADMIAQGHPNLIPQLKVADFGFARHLEAASLAETLCGSPLYMAPEILRYEKYDAKADLWSVGAVLFEMCVGKPPFRASNHVELLRRIERGEDKIKFPDERSDESLRREHQRRVDEGKETGDFIRPHVVDEDVKRLIRSLLRRRPIERLSFDDFFSSDVLLEYKRGTTVTARDSSELSSDRLPSSSPSPSPSGSAIVPIAKRVAPAVPANVMPVTRPATAGSVAANSTMDLQQEKTEKGNASSSSPVSTMRHYFAPKYVVASQHVSASHAIEGKQDSSNQGSKAADDARDHRRASVKNVSAEVNDGEASSLEDNVLETPGSSITHLPATAQQNNNSNEQSTATVDNASDASLKQRRASGYADDDRGYVMVEKRNLDLNAVAEDFNRQARLRSGGGGWSPLGAVRRPTQLGRLSSLSGAISPLSGLATPPLSTTAVHNQNTVSPTLPSPLSPASSAATATAIPGRTPVNSSSPIAKSTSPVHQRFSSTPPNAAFALPPNARKPSFTRRSSATSESRPTIVRPSLSPLVPAAASGSHGASSGSPASSRLPVHLTGVSSPAQTFTSSSSSALARAISMASVRLFGVPTNMSMRGADVRRSLRMGLGTGALMSSSPSQGIDPNTLGAAEIAEQNLLSVLHEYGQKSFVLSEFADARLASFFADGPHQNNFIDRRRDSSSSLSSMTGGGGTTSKGGNSLSSKASATMTTATTQSSVLHDGSPKSTLSHSEVAASEAYVLYVRSLSFLQRAMDAARVYLEARSISSSSTSRYVGGTSVSANSQDVIEAMQWLRAKFNDGVERAKFARGKSVEEMPESAKHIDKMIFEEALEVARRAAVDELENNRADEQSWSAERCLLAYETACTMLQSLLDPPDQTKDLSQSAIGTIEKFISSISKRMMSIQRKYETSSTTIGMSHIA